MQWYFFQFQTATKRKISPVSTSSVNSKSDSSTVATSNPETQSVNLGTNMKQYLGEWDLDNIPGFPSLENEIMQQNFSSNWNDFEGVYLHHCCTLVQAISELNFAR